MTVVETVTVKTPLELMIVFVTVAHTIGGERLEVSFSTKPGAVFGHESANCWLAAEESVSDGIGPTGEQVENSEVLPALSVAVAVTT